MDIVINKATDDEYKIVTDYIKAMLKEMKKYGGNNINCSSEKWDVIGNNIKKSIINEKEHIYYLAKDKVNNTYCGFGEARINIIGNVYEENRILHINSLYIDEKYRRNGIGKMIINKIIEWGKDLNYSEIDLNVLSSNPAKYLYKKLGFNEIEIKMNKRAAEQAGGANS